MRVELTGRHLTISPGLRNLVDRKLGKVRRVLNDAGVSAAVVVTKEKVNNVVELTLHARGELRIPEDGEAEAHYDATLELMGRAGLPAYEVSNHARPGAECRHNLVYWRYEDYVGVGPGAHGRLTLGGAKTATRQEKLPETWLARVRERGHGTAERVAVAPEDAAAEALMMGLRLAAGIDDARFARETGCTLDGIVDAGRLARLLDGGFIERTKTGLRVTPSGRKVLNAVLGALLA